MKFHAIATEQKGGLRFTSITSVIQKLPLKTLQTLLGCLRLRTSSSFSHLESQPGVEATRSVPEDHSHTHKRQNSNWCVCMLTENSHCMFVPVDHVILFSRFSGFLRCEIFTFNVSGEGEGSTHNSCSWVQG